MKDFIELKQIAGKYLRARKAFRDATDKIPELSGNDNLVGRIGEFIAIQFLHDKLHRNEIARNENVVQTGYDILADGKRVSVKVITAENKSGSTTPIREPWDELVFVELAADAEVSRIGFLEKRGFQEALRSGFLKSKFPIAKRRMLDPMRLIDRYGRVYKAEELGKYL
jgi:hypothetical protein